MTPTARRVIGILWALVGLAVAAGSLALLASPWASPTLGVALVCGLCAVGSGVDVVSQAPPGNNGDAR